MENKYYTPTIEEFYVGFEYEIVVYSAEEEKEWVKCIYSHPSDAMFCKDSNGNIWANESLRVKLLDREDIEFLGWKQTDYDTYRFGIDEMYLEFNPEYKTFIYSKKYSPNKNDILFAGTIKNKSELQKLMIQLNIK